MLRKPLLQAILATFLSVLLSTTAFSYSDVNSSDPDFAAIEYVEALGLFPGEDFEPEKIVTRGEFVKVLLDKSGFDSSSVDEYVVNFSDVESALAPYVERMRQFGIVIYTPFSNDFNPDKAISTRKALEMLMKFEGIPVPNVYNETEFKEKVTNVGSDAFYAPQMARAVQLDLVRVRSKSVPIFESLTRRDLAYMLYKSDGFKQKLDEAVGGTPSVPKIVISTSNTVDESLASQEAFAVFEDVWLRVVDSYYDKDSVDRDELLYGAINGLVERLDDPYSTFLEPELRQNLTDSLSNQVEGIGASLTEDDQGRVVVVSPISGSPAEEAGMLPGDIITKVNGVSVLNMSLSDVIGRVKGSAGTRVDVTVLRENRTKTFTITRAKITIPVVTTELTADNIAIITIRNFGIGSTASFDEFVDSLDLDSLNGIIIDLRNNPGGYLNAAVESSEYFTNLGETIVQVEYADRSRRSDKAVFTGELSNEEVVVLVNSGTASAAEIMAGALSESAGATLIGEKTFGKGTVQELIGYDDNSSLKLTIAHWLTPNGTDINGVGITPNIIVKTTDSDREAGNDPVLNRALLEFR